MSYSPWGHKESDTTEQLTLTYYDPAIPLLDMYIVSVCVFMCVCVCVRTQPCTTLYDPKDCSPPGSSVLGIFQARILEWGAISSSRRSS